MGKTPRKAEAAAQRQHQNNKTGHKYISTNTAAKVRKSSDNGLAQLSLVASQLLTGAGKLRTNSCSTTQTSAEAEQNVYNPKVDDPIVGRYIWDAKNAINKKDASEFSDNYPPLAIVVGADLAALHGPIAMAQPPTFYGFIKDEIDAALVAEAVVCGERRGLQFTPKPSFVRIVHGTVICIESSVVNNPNALFIG
ncbi:hypothetical protein HK100_007835, partial [Physocladia obscura]